MGDQDFGRLLSKINELAPVKETPITIGGATGMVIFAAMIGFLFLGFFTNAGDIKEMKLVDKYMKEAQVEMKQAIAEQKVYSENLLKIVTDIRMDQIRRERKEGR